MQSILSGKYEGFTNIPNQAEQFEIVVTITGNSFSGYIYAVPQPALSWEIAGAVSGLTLQGTQSSPGSSFSTTFTFSPDPLAPPAPPTYWNVHQTTPTGQVDFVGVTNGN